MKLLDFCKDLYTIPRSLTGKGVVKTLEYISEIVPLEIKNIKSGSKVFDWQVPPEWNVKKAYILDLNSGKRVVDLENHGLHILGYSKPVDEILSYRDLIKNIFYIKDQPTAIPYVTSYYSERWGFCMTYEDFKRLDKDSKFQVYIDSDLNQEGSLHYAELVIKGKVDKEIFISSYICHPQMVNNELSGPAVLTAIAKSLIKKENYYTYRFVLVPETIGSIAYLAGNLKILKEKVIGGFNITCVGDERSWGLVKSRYGNNISDEIAKHVLKFNTDGFKEYSWLERGSDERQYCSPGIDLPITSITRSKYGEYPEYHTSLDNFDLVTEKGLQDSLRVYLKCIDIFEKNNVKNPNCLVLGEPQLGKRGLYPTISTKESGISVRNMMNFLSYCDGKNSILDISNICNIPFSESYEYYIKFKSNGIID